MRQSHSPYVAVLIWKCVVIDLTGHKPPNEIDTNHRKRCKSNVYHPFEGMFEACTLLILFEVCDIMVNRTAQQID